MRADIEEREQNGEKDCGLSIKTINHYDRDESRDENAKKPLQFVFAPGAVLAQALTYETDLISH